MLNKKYNYITKTIIIILLLVFSLTLLNAAGTASSNPPKQKNEVEELFQQAKSLVDKKDFRRALPILEKANQRKRRNAEVLNLLAYTQRNLGRIDEAIENYKLALSIKPVFPEAREYLGEAYLQAALKELKILAGYGNKGKEAHEELKEAILEAAKAL